MRLICEGCGQPVPIPDGYRRNKIQCPCGVICSVPESARQEADSPSRARPNPTARSAEVEEEEVRWLPDDPPNRAEADESPRFRAPEPEERPEPKPAVAEPRFPCRRCRRLIRRQGECPHCNPDKVPAGQQEPVWWPSVDDPDDKGDEEEGSTPYGVEGGDEVRCPDCTYVLPPGSVLCVRCGFHFRKRKKVVKTYQPIEREWETNYSLSTRLALFGACEAVSLTLGLIGVFVGGAELGVFVGSFLLFTLMMGFLLGTYARIRLIRDPRGRVELIKTWRVCFVPLMPQTTEVRGYEGIASGQHRDVSNMDYIILLVLFISGIIPGLIWYYLAIHKVTFHVSLSRDHGFPAYVVYSGWDEMQMKEIAFTLRDATGLLYDAG